MSNTLDNLIVMANQIGLFFGSMPDRQQAQSDLAMHLKRSWEPRMRRTLLEYVDGHAGSHGGGELDEFVRSAIGAHRGVLQ